MHICMHVTESLPAAPDSPSDPVDAARGAIWRLFEEGYVDENMATAGLLAVDLGRRRTQRTSAVKDLPRQRPGDCG